MTVHDHLSITNSHFDPHSAHVFGDEASVPILKSREYKTITKEELKRYLVHTAEAIDPAKDAVFHWVAQAKAALLEEVLGNREMYDVQACLQALHAKTPATAADHLLERTLTLLSFDSMDPASVEGVSPLTVYDGLHVLDNDIQPELKTSGGNKLFVLVLYHDHERMIRFHIYPPGELKEIRQDNAVHQHYGSSGSLVLAGALVNQHFNVALTQDPSADYSMYEVIPDKPHEETLRTGRTFKRVSNAGITRVTSHVYGPGDHFFVPSPMSEGTREKFPFTLAPSDFMDYHKVGSRELTSSLFTVKYDREAGQGYDLAAMHNASEERKRGDEFHKDFAEYKLAPDSPPIRTFKALLPEIDVKIRQELANIEKPSTIIDRGKGNLVAERLPHYQAKGSAR